MRWRAGVAGVLVALLLSACSSEPETRFSDNQPEYQLAALDGQALTDAAISPYETALNEAENACQEERSLLGDYAFVAQEQLAEAGQSVTLLEMLKAMSDSVPEEMRPTRCADVMAAVVTLMQSR